MALKAQNLEIGETVTAELARFATAFGAGLLPAHTYYVGSSSWLVPVIKAKITSATVKVPCRSTRLHRTHTREDPDQHDSDCTCGRDGKGV